ncbi:hypothetical protein AU197_11390 [Mycobacterium sp. IS-1590]|uniref:hypothetical protein n=1 Tax=Mycobacterium sp. IS-1590 TaxID=1772286 RepID=UPI000747ACC2|nr:hypothetical protein [Mycobacterium sp. IS-1590]KUI43082.1 hypothetical protein AU197_11390 [Mycobacterium sp. IS-1590]
MAIRDWSKARFVLLIALPVLLLIGIPMVVWSYQSEPPGLSGDCLHVDQAMRQWMRVLPRIQRGMVNADDTALDADTAAAAAAIRAEAKSIEEPTLRSTVLKLADDLDRAGQGTPSSPPHGFPDRNYVGGMQDSMTTGYALKRACPEAVDDPLPGAP